MQRCASAGRSRLAGAATRGLRRAAQLLIALLVPAAWVTCGISSTNVVSDFDGGLNFSDADPNAPDAGPNQGCIPSGPACNNCVDDDGDGLIDGFDPECTGPRDNLEDSFATGIPGDNVDNKTQDCFFDGNSGGGDDKCKLHTCCLLDGPCPGNLQPPFFDPNDCTVSAECIANCAPLTPPGCDCFGCCTICGDGGCFDVLTNPAVAPDCTADQVADPNVCPRCSKIEECSGGECDSDTCVLCPGQLPEDLPPECDGNQCPAGVTPCIQNTDCLSGQFCSRGCCIRIIE